MKNILTNQEINLISGSLYKCYCICTGGYVWNETLITEAQKGQYAIGETLALGLCIKHCRYRGYNSGKCDDNIIFLENDAIEESSSSEDNPHSGNFLLHNTF